MCKNKKNKLENGLLQRYVGIHKNASEIVVYSTRIEKGWDTITIIFGENKSLGEKKHWWRMRV